MCLSGAFGKHCEDSDYIHTTFSVYKLYLQLIINPVLHFIAGFYDICIEKKSRLSSYYFGIRRRGIYTLMNFFIITTFTFGQMKIRTL